MSRDVIYAHDRVWLVVAPATTGLRYRSQCGGVSCLQQTIEGAVVDAFPTTGAIETIACDAGCQGAHDWTDARIQAFNKALASLGTGWQFDSTKHGESIEGWVWVQRDAPDYQEPDEWWPTAAVMIGPNCLSRGARLDGRAYPGVQQGARVSRVWVQRDAPDYQEPDEWWPTAAVMIGPNCD